MMQDLLTYTSIAIMCAVTGFVYTNILTDPGQIFDKLYSCLEQKLEKKYPKLFNVLIGCEKCVSGQMALWTLVAIMVRDLILLPMVTGDAPTSLQLFLLAFHPLDFIYTISASIFMAYLLAKLYQWTKREGN